MKAGRRQIVVNRKQQTLKLYARPFMSDEFHLWKKYDVSTGVVGLKTPPGRYIVANRQRRPDYTYPDSDWVPVELRGKHYEWGDPENPIVGRWLGLGSEDPEANELIASVGIHGSRDEADLGTRASHGCIRMSEADSIDLYPQAPVNTTVFIV